MGAHRYIYDSHRFRCQMAAFPGVDLKLRSLSIGITILTFFSKLLRPFRGPFCNKPTADSIYCSPSHQFFIKFSILPSRLSNLVTLATQIRSPESVPVSYSLILRACLLTFRTYWLSTCIFTALLANCYFAKSVRAKPQCAYILKWLQLCSLYNWSLITFTV